MQDMTPNHETDILIAGAGPAGLAAACVLGAAGHSVTLVDPAAPVTGEDAPGADLRTTALLQPARVLLETAGTWEGLARHAMPLDVMRIVDAAATPPVIRDFVASDIGLDSFGWNVPNWLLRRELLARVTDMPQVTTRFGHPVAGLLLREAGAYVRLSDGTAITAALVIACDGADSPLRRMAGIGARRIDHDQVALVLAVEHDMPHGNVSTEVHRQGGPFTLVPLPDRDGRHRSAVVWMDEAEAQARRRALPPAALAAEVQDRSAGVLGPLHPVGQVAGWPIRSVLADRLTARRFALAGEAAHAMPPIGAQGLNTSLSDIAQLRDLCAEGDPGDGDRLATYQRRRWPVLATRMAGIGALNAASRTGLAPLQVLRAHGLAVIHDVAPLRRAMMRLGLAGRPGGTETPR